MLVGGHQQLQRGVGLLRHLLDWPKLCLVLLLSGAFALGYFEHRAALHVPLVRWIRLHTHPRYIESLTHAASLPMLSIDVKFKHLKKLRANRQQAIERGVLLRSGKGFVPAKLRFDGKTIPAKLRLKGDWPDHWTGDKWSYRILINGDNHWRGMRRFSVQHPKTRRYLYEWGFLKTLRREDILAPRYDFIKVVFNGEDRGIYALEEHFSKELLESQQRRDGVILKLDENELWAEIIELGGPDLGLRHASLTNYPIDVFRSTRIDANPLLAKQRDEAIGLFRAFSEGRRKPSAVFDVEVMGRYMALTDLWFARHAVVWTNARFYYNPVSARLEPIGFDALPFKLKGYPLGALVWNEGWRRALLQDPVTAAAYVRNLVRVSDPAYLEDLKTEFGEEMQALLGALHREFTLAAASRLPWRDVEERQEYIRKVLSPPRMVLAFSAERAIGQAAERSGDLIELRNVLELPVAVVGLQVGEGSIIPAQSAWIQRADNAASALLERAVLLPAARRNAPPQYASFAIPSSSAPPLQAAEGGPTVYVHTRLVGHDRIIRTPVRYQPQAITTTHYDEEITVELALAQHEFLERRADPADLWIKSGAWEVHEDLVIPKGMRLRAGPDTSLKFGEDVALVAQGPVEFKGAPDQPVVLEPLNATWPGMVVMKAGRSSVLTHVTIRRTRGIARGGWILTGGVTFYKSPVLINDCHFENSRAEDGLNIIRTEFWLRDTRFSNCVSDAFDGDFVTGKVEGCEFADVRADGIDVSGSEVTIERSVFDRIGDKAISVGERSTVQVRSISVSQSRFGVVSKDCSRVSVERSTLRQVQYGLAAFVKKPEFGPAHLEAQEIRMIQVAKPSLLQTGSTMTIDGQNQAAEELDVDSLYRTSATDERKNGKV